jgi:thioredoxin-dependent peroxiredoxin
MRLWWVGVLLVAVAGFAHAGPSGSSDSGVCLNPGDPAPDVEMQDPYGYPVRLSELWAKGPVVLYFYPKDFTPGCTLESEGFRDAIDAYGEARILIAGISIDTPESHRKFAERLELPFSLLSDPHASAAEAYGVLKTFYGFVTSRRVTYLIDSDGTVAWVWDEVEPDGHAQDVIAEARRLGLHHDQRARRPTLTEAP